MTYLFTTLVLFLMSLATGIYAFGRFHEPAPSVALVLFIAFTSLLVMSATFEFFDYRAHPPRTH
jgi:ABC-type transport system involved in cytochrome c biogenesis permease component